MSYRDITCARCQTKGQTDDPQQTMCLACEYGMALAKRDAAIWESGRVEGYAAGLKAGRAEVGYAAGLEAGRAEVGSYARHHGDCEVSFDHPCTCGLDALLAVNS